MVDLKPHASHSDSTKTSQWLWIEHGSGKAFAPSCGTCANTLRFCARSSLTRPFRQLRREPDHAIRPDDKIRPAERLRKREREALAASPRSPLAHYAKAQVLRAQQRFDCTVAPITWPCKVSGLTMRPTQQWREPCRQISSLPDVALEL